ncbi:allantoate permease [Colletotrichum tamarilloi]|uniref:Allantoate permease n=1 Tax=Colletotrichum tamarilloi TaxID=1209934 RepID=A0ABQ9QIC9_9PEZI|nr:allantoate permease [Colletotrichum tamarilloi]KAK1471749.1 allantoate permease [Colletotrichum tamarilloi]
MVDTIPDIADTKSRKSDVEHVEQDLQKPQLLREDGQQEFPEIYLEALARYPNDESIDQADEKRLLRKLDMRILPLLGICYFFYYVDKTTLYGLSSIDPASRTLCSL